MYDLDNCSVYLMINAEFSDVNFVKTTSTDMTNSCII